MFFQKTLLIFLLLTPLAHSEYEFPKNPFFSLVPYAPSAQLIGGVRFPRIGPTTYRGVEPKLYSVTDAIQAMLGDSTKNVESILMSAIKFKLMGRFEQAQHSFIRERTAGDWWRRDIHGDNIDEIIEKLIINNGGPFSEDKAIELAKNFINQSYINQKARDAVGHPYDTIPERIMNYMSESYSDFPRDVVFSSIYQKTSRIYGAGILVIKEDPDKPRSLDLTYWNYVYNNFWKGGGDTGEFLFPGYIDASEVAGYEIHTRGNYPNKISGGVRFDIYKIQKNEPIEIAMYKTTHQGERYILVFDGIDKDGKKRHCLRKGNDHRYFFCKQNRTNVSYNPLPRLTDIEANLMGVIKLCPKSGYCSKPDSLINMYRYHSNRRLPDLDQYANGLGHGDISSHIEASTVSGMQAKYFRANKSR